MGLTLLLVVYLEEVPDHISWWSNSCTGYHPSEQKTQAVTCLQSRLKQHIMLQLRLQLLKEALRSFTFRVRHWDTHVQVYCCT